jgi:hypothetical protein
MKLRTDICAICTASLPSWSSFVPAVDDAWYMAMQAAGFAGVCGADAAACHRLGLVPTSGGRVDNATDADDLARRIVAQGIEFAAIHVGNGFESDDEADRLVEIVLDASRRHGAMLHVETHRATITQDMQRTLRLVEKFPELTFCGDFSHWYTGQELRYGGKPITPKLDRIQPVFDRVRCLQLRIGTGGCMQVPVDPVRDADAPWLRQWEEILTRVFTTFRRVMPPDSVLPVAPELLPAANGYAREIPGPDGTLREESDRWQQALVLTHLARRWWEKSALAGASAQRST